MSRFAKDRHKRVARMLGYCLTIGRADAWAGFSIVAFAHMDEAERTSLVLAALRSLDPERARMTAAVALGESGAPLPSFLGGMDDAEDWAGWASPAELDAYCLACFQRMAPTRQAAFLRFVQRRAAA